MLNSEQNPSLRSGQDTAIPLIAGLNKIVAVQVSNLRGEAANWKQGTISRITVAG